ncbi:MAG: hypothetical protein AMXMBFR64_43090 [Myxococcales bacterium]
MAVIDDTVKKILEAFDSGNLALGDGLTKDAFAQAAARRSQAVDASTSARAALTKASNDRKAANKDLTNLVTRIRAATKGKYGPDSTEYELVGGVRTSERKRPKKKAATTA